MTTIIIRGLLIVLVGVLWRIGGSGNLGKNSKLVRRLGCPIVIGIAAMLSKNWYGVISLPLLVAAFSLGYGPYSILMKKIKNPYIVRLICGMLYALASIFIISGWLLYWHLFITSLGVMLAGNQKFKWLDKREEFYIGMLVGLHPILGG
jgi:hypothetical protein